MGMKRVLGEMENSALVRMYNSASSTPVKKFRNKADAVDRIMALNLSARRALRYLLMSGHAFLIEDLVEATGMDVKNVRTVMADLKSPKYAGKEGPIDINQIDGYYFVEAA